MFDFLTQMFNSAAAPRPIDSRPVEVIKAEVLATHDRIMDERAQQRSDDLAVAIAHYRARLNAEDKAQAALDKAQAATESRLRHEHHMQVLENQQMIMRGMAILLSQAKLSGMTTEGLMDATTATAELLARIKHDRKLRLAEEDTSRD